SLDHAPPAPLNFCLPGSASFVGLGVDLMHALGDRLGLTLRYRYALWSLLLDDVRTGGVDLICGAGTVTSARQLIVDSRPHLDIDLVLVACSSGRVHPIDDIRGRRVGVRVGTEAEDYVRCLAVGGVSVFDFNTEQYDALEASAVTAVLDDAP